MFRKASFKPGKNQIRGRLKPQMLAAMQRQLAQKNKPAARKPKPKIVLKDLAAYEPHINIDLSNIRLPMLLLLLVFVPMVLADTNVLRILIDGINMHGQPVALLPSDADCQRNPVGTSNGRICTFGRSTYYMKLLEPSETRRTRHLSYEAFNHQLAKTTIGINTAKFSFFRQTAKDPSTYIASEHVNGIKFITERDGLDKLKKSDTAKWAVAATFIFDLHQKNVGYTDEGIVALDLDGHDRPLTNNLLNNLINAAYSIHKHAPWLSIDDVKQMRQIYHEMQNKPLPDHHDDFHLTEKMYQDMLSAFINICDTVISTHDGSQPKVNQLWCQTAKNYIASQSSLGKKLSEDLCFEIISDEYSSGPHFY